MQNYAIRTEAMGPSDLVDEDVIATYQAIIDEELERAGIHDVEVWVGDGKYNELPNGERLEHLHPGLSDALERAWNRFCNQ